jgi:hypothetical protein
VGGERENIAILKVGNGLGSSHAIYLAHFDEKSPKRDELICRQRIG